MEPATVVLPRRPHVKSRSGCIECKRRRIKCGEEKPACNNCARFSKQSECVFIVPKQRAKPRARSKPAAIPSPAESQNSNDAHSHPRHSADVRTRTTSNTPELSPLSEPELPSLNVLELRLMLQFYNSTHKTLTTSPEFKNLWQNELLEYSLNFEFMTRSMLALSALELAQTMPDPHEKSFYTSHAMLQHQTALRLAHKALEDATAENCSALHIFSGLAFIFTMAKPRDGVRALLGESSIMAEWFSIAAGIKAIRESFSDCLDAGPHGPMLLAARHTQSLRIARARQEPLLHELECLVRTHVIDHEELGIYVQSLDYLHVCFDIMTSDYDSGVEYECADAFSWFFAVPREFVDLLKCGAQEALAIFTFAATLFLKIERFWWAQGWTRYLVAEAYDGLDDIHREWVRWPMEQVGFLPPSLYCID